MPGSRRGGGVSRRCECRGPDGKRLGAACPLMARKNHGQRQIRQELPPLVDADGKVTRGRFRRVGYATVTEAETDLDAVRRLIDLAGDDTDAQQRITKLLLQVAADRAPIPDTDEVRKRLGVGVELDGKLTLGELLETWLAGKRRRGTTLRGYESHIRIHLVPHLGHLRADRLTEQHVTAMFDAINERNETVEAENQARREQEARCKYQGVGRPKGEERERLAAERTKLDAMPPYRRVTGPMTQQRIRATLRSALNSPLARRHVSVNPATKLEMVQARRPKALLWTDAHVARWRETGAKPSPVMVWTLPQVGAFLDHAEGNRLYAFYFVMMFRGLRRGEGVGQAWADIDLDELLLTVSTEIVQDGWTPVETEAKTDGSAATIALGKATAQVLREHRVRQLAEKEKAGERWVETGKVFTTETGEWLHPDLVTKEFKRLYREIGLPPVNLRDVRHIAATLVHAGGGDLHAIKETLRHSTITLASDTYTSLLTEVDRDIAEKAEGLVPRARKPGAGSPDPVLQE